MVPDPRRVRELFDALMDVPPGERLSKLNAMCGEDEELLTEVKSLVVLTLDESSATEPDGSFAPQSDVPQDRRASIAPGTEVGNCVVDHVLGFGGFAEVYRAEQASPRRRVALKVAIADADPAVLERFKTEPDTLARLDHPAIARVFEAAIFEVDGGHRPYFVMEYIEGARPITRYARDHGVGLAGRLGMFIEVADAVSHAHQKGVIHRDLSSSNILVSRDGQVKVIDFGIARLFDATERTMTSVGVVLGTVSSMSPEQISGRTDEIDVRTDVWALGALLYEMVCERPAYDVRGLPVFEARRKILNESPSPASSSLGVSREGINVRDLDRVIARAMAREARDRYDSVRQLADDVRCVLDRTPIAERSGTLRAQVVQLWHRHRGPVALAGGLGVVVLGLAVFSFVFAARERIQRRTLEEQGEILKARSAEADAISSVFVAVLESWAAQGRGDELISTVEQELDRYRASNANAGAATSTLLRILASHHADRGRHDLAIEHLREALELVVLEEGSDPSEAMGLHQDLSASYRASGEPRRAVVHSERALELALRVPSPERWTLASIHAGLAAGYEALGELDRARTSAVDALRLIDRDESGEPPVGHRLDDETIGRLRALADAAHSGP